VSETVSNVSTEQQSEESAQPSPKHSIVFATIAAIAAWIVPGLGHLLVGRWGRALVFFLTVGLLALIGYGVRGNVFQFHPADFQADPFSFLGSLADVGSGIFYFLSKTFEPLGPDVARAAGDYGTRFIATAGLINFLCVFDAFEIASGKKQ
jgi:hypothetical protein